MSAIKLTVLLTSDGVFEIHRSGCRDITRTGRAGKVQNEFTIEVGTGPGDVEPSEYAVILNLWSDQISESTGYDGAQHANEAQAVADYAGSTKIHDCVKFLTPMGEGGASPSPSRKRQTAAQRKQAANMAKAKSKSGQKLGTGPNAAISQPMAKNDAAVIRQEHKRRLATRVVEAAAAMPELSDEDRKVIAHWLHHLPADRERWVAAGLPKPDRSDWR